MRQLPVTGGEQRREDVGAQARQQRLALGVAQARVELDQLYPIRRVHQPREQDATERRAPPRHLGQRRTDDAGQDRRFKLGRHAGPGRDGAHPAGVRAGVAVAHALVVPGRAERDRVRAVAEREE